ncbi:MAG: gamma-glutamyl-gamma-aminobutyrate hydrolase family protein [Streptosporangiales bacterium]|nr:gamma-glutamyl-gamma-aminobutyrate hydrolase family protein [Streptosporangiales bacterium]
MRPVIGITGYPEQAKWAGWDMPATLLPQRYVDQVVGAGGVPLVLPPVAGIGGALDRLDGLVLAGGGDIEPARYGAAPHPRTGRVHPGRDEAETALLSAALATGLPVLAICRGLQVLNVVRGGTLHQHLPDVVGDTAHAPERGRYGTHDVTVTPGSLIAETLGRTELTTSTYHHQAIDLLGEGLRATAHAADGVIEGVEVEGHPYAIGVQWHPEVDADPSLFAGLVLAAVTRRDAESGALV